MPATTPPKGRPTVGKIERDHARRMAKRRARIWRAFWLTLAVAVVVVVYVVFSESGTGTTDTTNTNRPAVPVLAPG
jgi:hypothetical protein